MKKILTSALVATMVAGSAVTVFANTEVEDKKVDTKSVDQQQEEYDINNVDNMTFGTTITVGEKKYDLDSKEQISTIKIASGESVFVPFVFDTDEDGKGDINVTRKSDVDDIRLYVKVASGDKYVGDSEIVKQDDVYGAKIDIKDYFGSEDVEIEAKLDIKNRRTGKTISTTEDFEKMPSFQLANETNEFPSKGGVTEFDVTDETEIVEFDDETTFISFAGNGFYFDGKASNQSPLFLGVSYAPIKDISIAYQDADFDFINFPGKPEFDFSGDFSVLVPDPDETYYLYEIQDNGALAEIKSEYNKEDETMVVRTKTLGQYILSDKELEVDDYNNDKDVEADKEDDKDTDEDKKPEEDKDDSDDSNNNNNNNNNGGTSGDKENVGTGSADMIGVASAISVVSLATAGFVATKKRK